MIRLVETKNEDRILALCKGRTLRDMCGNADVTDSQIREMVRCFDNVFLVAIEDEKDVGFIVFFPCGDDGHYSIHLCLKTRGELTKLFVGMAMEWIRNACEATKIYAIYDKSRRSVSLLCRYFGFEDSAATRFQQHFDGYCVQEKYLV